MFGYITPLKSELKVKEFEYFRSYYCGLCHEIKNNYGNIPRFCLNYELTFVGFLLEGLYSDVLKLKYVNCIKHYGKKIIICDSTPALKYCSDLSILLFDYKLKDNIEDDKSIKSKFFELLLSSSCKKSLSQLSLLSNKISKDISSLSNLENSKDFTSLDEICHFFSNIMGNIISNFPCEFEDESTTLRDNLYWLGYFMGKWIYLIDALDDLFDDMKDNKFNPYCVLFNKNSLTYPELITNSIKEIDFNISNSIINCSEYMKKIPFKKHYSIIENVITLGMVSKYYDILKKLPGDLNINEHQ